MLARVIKSQQRSRAFDFGHGSISILEMGEAALRALQEGEFRLICRLAMLILNRLHHMHRHYLHHLAHVRRCGLNSRRRGTSARKRAEDGIDNPCVDLKALYRIRTPVRIPYRVQGRVLLAKLLRALWQLLADFGRLGLPPNKPLELDAREFEKRSSSYGRANAHWTCRVWLPARRQQSS